MIVKVFIIAKPPAWEMLMLLKIQLTYSLCWLMAVFLKLEDVQVHYLFLAYMVPLYNRISILHYFLKNQVT